MSPLSATQEISPGLVIQRVKPPLVLADFKLIAFDMDSTLISIECIDEIADAVGKKAEVAAITEATMRGEIKDFKESLRRRVALLKGVPVAALQQVYDERLKLNPGAAELVAACKKAGLKVLLVSGGFTFFANRVKDRLGIDFARSQPARRGRWPPHRTGRHAKLGRHLRRRRKAPHAARDRLADGHFAARDHCRGRWRERPADDGRSGPFGGLPRQAEGARTGHGGHQRRRARPPAGHRQMTTPADTAAPLYRADALQDYASALLQKAGLAASMADSVARTLVEGDLLGHDTHGLALLAGYVKEVESGGMTRDGAPEVLSDRPAAVLWDGKRLPGPWLMDQGMDLLIPRARQLGTASLVIRRSHHIACLAVYMLRALQEDMLMLLACSDPNTASVAPFGGTQAVFTPNPLAMGFPLSQGGVMVDISASITTNGHEQPQARGRRDLC
jgi:HAD superfamily phosphoserine phosphatase-like hydrolase